MSLVLAPGGGPLVPPRRQSQQFRPHPNHHRDLYDALVVANREYKVSVQFAFRGGVSIAPVQDPRDGTWNTAATAAAQTKEFAKEAARAVLGLLGIVHSIEFVCAAWGRHMCAPPSQAAPSPRALHRLQSHTKNSLSCSLSLGWPHTPIIPPPL